MPLDDLVSVIETLQARLQSHRQELEANEIRTRMALIDPLLQALGWDTADPALVLPEYDLSGKKPDYALLDGTATPVAFVEAKHLGISLASHREQIVRYAVLSGVPYAGLTDGDHWELYRVFNPSPFDRSSFEDRLLLDISVAESPAHEAALKLLLLWQPNLAAGQPVAANEPILTTVTKPAVLQPVDKPENARPPAPPPEQPSEPPPTGAGWAPLSELSSATGKPSPTAIWFPDGNTREVQFWWELPASVAGWLWSQGLLTASNVPVKWSERTHIANTDGKQPSGKPFIRPQPIAGTPLILEANMSGEAAVNRAKKLLQEYGVSLAEVQLQVAED